LFDGATSPMCALSFYTTGTVGPPELVLMFVWEFVICDIAPVLY